MDKVLTTTLLTMAAVIAAVMVINTILPALGRSSSSLLSSTGAASERIKTDVKVVHIATDSSANEVYIWVKNVGAAEVTAISDSDVFHESTSTTTRLDYNTGSNPYWNYNIEGTKTTWKPGVTIKITIFLASLPGGDYEFRLITNNGESTEKSFSV